MQEEFHDHCRSCYNKFCNFDIVQDVSCHMVSCVNDCGQKLHICKQEDHELICLSAQISCINKQYGCPAEFCRRYLAQHLEVCPANVVICMMEWNRWHRGSLLSKGGHVVRTKQMQDKPIIHSNLDVALAIHDQRVLLETIMPREILEYYNELAERKSSCIGVSKLRSSSDISEPENVTSLASRSSHELEIERLDEDLKKIKEVSTVQMPSGEGSGHASSGKEEKSEYLAKKFREQDKKSDLERTDTPGDNMKTDNFKKVTEINGHRSITKDMLLYVNSMKLKRHKKGAGCLDLGDSITKEKDNCSCPKKQNSDVECDNADVSVGAISSQASSSHCLSSPQHQREMETLQLCHDDGIQSETTKTSSLPYNGLFSQNSTTASGPTTDETSNHKKVAADRGMMSDFEHLDNYIQKFASSSPQLMALLNSPDSDLCDTLDTVDFLVNEVTRQQDGENHQQLPVINWNDSVSQTSSAAEREKASYELHRSISEMMHELGVVCDLTRESSDQPTHSAPLTSEERRRNRRAERKKRSWLYSTGIAGAPLTSWGWGPRKEVKDVSTDTDDLEVDRSNLEWLSPEAILSRTDLISRLFSIIGASHRGHHTHEHKHMTPYIVDSWSQTVAPFLVHLDMNTIGRALCSSSLTSGGQNQEERKYILSLLTKGYTEESKEDLSSTKMSENLAYNNLVLDSIMESVPRYQTKQSSMFSFMCGCELRRDQFVSHIANVHCEIMAGLNGWIEQKCPYATYGCEYSQPRFCPNHHDNALVYDQTQNSFAVRPQYLSDGNLESESSTTQCSFIELPYEIHERIMHFLDSFSMSQLSRTCHYMREVCRAHLIRRGIVRTQWRKRTYDDGTQAWKMEKQIWSFPSSFTKISRWVLSDRPAMVQHVSRCPVAAAHMPNYEGRGKFKIIP